MTGPLDISQQKNTNVGTPTDEKDVVPKEYVDQLLQHEHEVSLHSVGRYIVLPNEDNTKKYFSVRAKKKKHVDLDNGKLIEVSSEGTHNVRPV